MSILGLSAYTKVNKLANEVNIPSQYVFANNTARDSYFASNPTELIEGLLIAVGTGFQKYINGTWIAYTGVIGIQGPKGDKGDSGEDSIARAAITALQNQKGQPSGIATLDSSGKVPLEQLPEDIGSGGVDAEARASIAQLESQYNDIAKQVYDNADMLKQKIDMPNAFDGWRPLNFCTNASAWAYDAVNSTATGTITEVTEIDTTAFNGALLPAGVEKPWLFSENGALRGLGNAVGNKMLKFEVTTQGMAYFHVPLPETEDFSESGELVYALWMDTLSSDVDTNAVMEFSVYHNYPSSLTDLHRVDSLNPAIVDGRGNWILAIVPGMRQQSSPAFWKQVGAAPIKIATLATINGIGFRITNTKSDGKVARFYVSGIFRVNPTLDKGKLIIDFDDGYLSQYTEAFNYMNAKGLKGSISVVGSWVRSGFHGEFPTSPIMTIPQIQEVDNAGWDITSHTWSHKNLVGDVVVQQSEIQKNYDWLKSIGINKGSRFLIYPGGKSDRWTPYIAKQYHCLGRTTSGPDLHVFPPTRQWTMPAVTIMESTSETTWRRFLQTAETHKCLKTVVFHNIGSETTYGDTTVAKFRSFIDMISEYDIEVVTRSDLWDKYILHL